MTGKKVIAAKLLALTSVLAAGGGGAYCYTSGATPWKWFTNQTAATKAELKPETGGASTLDAVASAWAEGKSPASGDSAAASRVARSADETLANAAKDKTPAPTSGSRYDRYGTMQLPSPAGDSAGLTAALPEVKSAAVDAASDGLTVVRGQNPTETQSAAVDATTMREGNLNTGSGAQQINDDFAPASAGMGAAAARARQAFGDVTPAAGADRYRTAAADSARKAANPPADSVTPLTPYSPGISPMPISAAASALPASDGLQPLPTARGSLNEAATPAASGYDRLAEPNRFSPSGYGAAAGSGNDAAAQRGFTGNNAPTSVNQLGNLPTGGMLGPANDGLSGAEGSGKPGERALEGQQNPALSIHKQAPPEIQVGKPAKFLIKVRNSGNQAATDVVVHDEVPQGTRLVSTAPLAEANGGHLMWRFGTLSVGEERTIEMQVMPTAEGDIGSVATVNYSAQASVKTRSTMPQLAIKMTAPKQVMVGQEQRVKILLNNPGSGDATGVMLFENVPENVKHASGPALEFEVGTLRAGETRELELVLLAQKPGKVANVLSARAEGNLQVQQQVDFEVISPALTVAVVGPERRYLERPATYEVRVENPGTATARDIQLVTKLPKGLKFVRANNMGEYDAATHAVYWSLAELPEKERGTVELVAMPIETGPQTLEVEGRAQQGLADQTKQQILIEGLAAIMFEVRDLVDPIEAGGETTYEIRIVNQGTKAASNVQVAVALPQGMQFVSAEGETRHQPQQGGVVFAPLKQLAPKADTVYRLKVQCRAPGDQRVTVEVKTDDLAQPIRREESTRVFGDE